jgi:hypothetical protein
MARQAAEKEREKDKADKAAERQRQQDSRTALELFQTGKSQDSNPAAPNRAKKKRQKRVGGAAAIALFPEAAPEPLLCTSKSGRTIKPKEKYE